MKITGGLRFRVCPDCGEMHDRDEWPGNHRRPGDALSAPNVVSDIMDAVQSQATGAIHDSKSNIRKEYRRLGMVEVGNDPSRLRTRKKQKTDRAQVKQSLDKAEARFNRGERTSDAMKFK